MPSDLAINYNTGDIIMAPTNDIAVRTGTAVLEQRIRTRLRIRAGQWPLDPTGGELGSGLLEMTRVPTWRALTDIPRVVREALAPMDDLTIHDVSTEIDPKDDRRIIITLSYSSVEPSGEAGATATLSTVLTTG